MSAHKIHGRGCVRGYAVEVVVVVPSSIAITSLFRVSTSDNYTHVPKYTVNRKEYM